MTPEQRIAYLETQLDAERRRVPGRYAFYHRHLSMSRVRQRDPELANWASVDAGHFMDQEGAKTYQDVVAALESACETTYLCLLQSLPATRARAQRELALLRDAIALARGASPEDVQNEFEERAGITP